MPVAQQARGARVIGRRRFLALGAVAGLLNSNFVLATVLPGDFVSAAAPISELSVAGQPWSWAFRLGDASSGVLLLTVAAAGLRHQPPTPARATQMSPASSTVLEPSKLSAR